MAPTGGQRRQAAIAAKAKLTTNPALAAAIVKRKASAKGKGKVSAAVTHGNSGKRIHGKNIFMDLDDDDDGSSTRSDVDSLNVNKRQRVIAPRQPPPITIQSHTVAQIKQSIAKIKDINHSGINYKITQSGVKIITPSTGVFDIVKKYCADNNMKGYTHTAAEDRLVKICLYGLWSMPMEDLKEELKAAKIEPVEVKQMTLSKPRYSDQAIYILYFQRKQHITVDALKAVRGLFNVIVDWRYYKSRSKEPTQCEICLQFGHGKSNCFGKSAVCFRCSGDHSGSRCPFLLPETDDKGRRRIDDKLLKCVLCSKMGHTATDRKCEARIKYKELQQSLRMKSQPQPRPTPNFKSNEFPAIPRPNRPFMPAPPPKNPAWKPKNPLLPCPSSDLLNSDECMELFEYFIDELLKCRSKVEQIKTIARLSLEQVTRYLNSPSTSNDASR